MKWYLVLFTLLLSGCSAEYHLKKAVKKDPSILKKDTVIVHDTTVLPSVVLRDTVRLKEIDTLVLTKEKLNLKIVRVKDTFQIDAECKGDTIIKTISVPIERVSFVEKDKWYHKMYRYTFFGLLFIVIASILKRLLDNYADKL